MCSHTQAMSTALHNNRPAAKSMGGTVSDLLNDTEVSGTQAPKYLTIQSKETSTQSPIQTNPTPSSSGRFSPTANVCSPTTSFTRDKELIRRQWIFLTCENLI